jgi:peptide/nickel transport system substrate-binding protein
VALGPDLDVVPALAVSWSNPDALTWVFRLRPGVRFHDGSALTAGDVVYSVTRLQSDETLAARSEVSVVTSASVEDGAVVFRTARPSARLLNELSQVAIVRAGSTHEELESHPNGTGPYAVGTWAPRRALRLRRHEGYWGPRPAHDVVDVEFGASDETAAAGLRDGRLSMVAHLGAALAAGNPRYRVVRQPNPFVRHLAFDLSSRALAEAPGVPNPFRRREVRQAIDVALDRALIARAASPNAYPERHIVSDRVFGRDATPAAPAPDLPEARRLLAVAGYRDGFAVTLARSRAPDPATDELAAQFARVGIRVSVATASSNSEFTMRLQRRALGFWVTSDACLTGEAGGLLATVFHSPDPRTALGLENYGGAGDDALDRAIEETDAILEPGPRLPLLQAAVRQAERRLAWIPLYRNEAVFVVDRALAFEPRADLLVRYAEIRRAAPEPKSRD